MLKIEELLHKHGLLQNVKTKFVHSADSRVPLHDNYKFDIEKFLFWQASNQRPVFHHCDYIISFPPRFRVRNKRKPPCLFLHATE